MIALVTGASDGIGLELARLFAADGHDLVLVSRGAERLGVVARDLEERFKVEVRAIPRDLSNPIAPASLFDECGEIDFLVNNAGFGSMGSFVESDPAMLGEMLQVNVAALTQLTRLFLPSMVERGRGAIVNVASRLGQIGVADTAAYSAAKAGLIGLTRALAKEFGPHGIRVNAVAPGLIVTRLTTGIPSETRDWFNRLTPLGDGFGQPEDIADVIAFLASGDARFVTGVCVPVDGGLSLGLVRR